MKTKELSKQVRDKVVEKYISTWVLKKYQKLNIPRSTIKSINKTLKEYGTTANLPREGRPPKLTDPARKVLIIEATKRPKITLKVLQSSTAEIGVSVHRTTLSHTLHRAGLYGRLARRKPLLKERNMQTRLVFIKRHVGDSPNIWMKVLWSDETKIELFGHQGNAMSGTNSTPLITPRTPSAQ